MCKLTSLNSSVWTYFVSFTNCWSRIPWFLHPITNKAVKYININTHTHTHTQMAESTEHIISTICSIKLGYWNYLLFRSVLMYFFYQAKKQTNESQTPVTLRRAYNWALETSHYQAGEIFFPADHRCLITYSLHLKCSPLPPKSCWPQWDQPLVKDQ